MHALHALMTDRLDLRCPDPEKDLDGLFAIFTDPDSWWYDPDGRHREPARTKDWLIRAAARFEIDQLSYWTVRRRDDGTVIPAHDHASDGEPELYYTVDGDATFSIDGEDVEAPVGTCLWIDPKATRAATARDPGTLVLSVGAGPPGTGYKPAGWDSHYLEGDK